MVAAVYNKHSGVGVGTQRCRNTTGSGTTITSVVLVLSFKQLWQQYPAISIIPADFETHLVCDSCSININDVICMTNPPIHLQLFDRTTQSIVPMGKQVAYKLYCFRKLIDFLYILTYILLRSTLISHPLIH